MSLLTDLLYLLIAAVTSPIWLYRMIRTGKIRTDWSARFGRGEPVTADPGRPRILLHAVSVGEVNAIRRLVEQLAAHPDLPLVIVATTTDTGFARARQVFGDRHPVVRYPFDVAWAVQRFLDRVQPDVVALVELEVWPNLTRECERRGVPMVVINGRLTERSARRYGLIAPLLRPTFRRLDRVAAQSDAYARRFIALGVPDDRVDVLGTMKWDTAVIEDDVPGATDLAESMGIDRARPLIVAGSTAPGEHELLHDAVPEDVQLLCAPRKPEWFEQAAEALPGCARRSQGDRGSVTGRFLLDTIGELRLAYALADIVVVGRSFGDLHGSDMAEPIALGRPTIIGPRYDDFEITMAPLLEAGGIVVATRDELPSVLADLLSDASRRRDLADRGRTVVRDQQGATDRHVDLLICTLQKHRRPNG